MEPLSISVPELLSIIGDKEVQLMMAKKRITALQAELQKIKDESKTQ